VLGTTLAVIASLPWVVAPVVTVLRLRKSCSLDDESPDPPLGAPRVSVIIPARNEAHNIERCVRSVLSTSYPDVEVIVVDDDSDDGTGEIVRRIAAEDPRLRLTNTEPLPAGWFGKQWACATGARLARGEILCFTDADTFHSGDLLTRSVNGMLRRKADLFSVITRQEMGSFWERLIQPQVFTYMAVRYGSTEAVTNSKRIEDKIANGQCLFVDRRQYESLGGHSLVKDHVAEDLMLAQKFFAAGKRVVLEAGMNQISARMYTSLSDLIEGWGKNAFAGGRDTMPFGRAGKLIFPFLLLTAPLMGVIPPLLLVLSLTQLIAPPVTLWAGIATTALLVWWLNLYIAVGESPLYGLLSPVGAAVVLYIYVKAITRGDNVTWKGRQYVSG
jgi:chlorobactene glucosyltransferase